MNGTIKIEKTVADLESEIAELAAKLKDLAQTIADREKEQKQVEGVCRWNYRSDTGGQQLRLRSSNKHLINIPAGQFSDEQICRFVARAVTVAVEHLQLTP